MSEVDTNPGLASAVRRARRRALLAQEELAEQAGLSVRCIRAVESGEVTEPRLSTLRHLFEALGENLDEVPVDQPMS